MANAPQLLPWIPAFPLLAALVIAAGGNALKEASRFVCWAALGASFVLSLLLLSAGPVGAEATVYQWLDFRTLSVPVVFKADTLTAIMLCTVTGVGLLVSIFSAGYMHDDPGFPRFFAEFSLFVFSMTGLVLAGNFFLLYIFWEAVGLCSYLLIGFWFYKPEAAAAARKAFLVNRIGDFGFILGIFFIWREFGSVNFDDVLGNPARIAEFATAHPNLLTLMCLLLLMGAVGKSAQFPLHVWLPDAMEGPTPASALIHAATMVTAGVYMIARLMPLFVHSSTALMFVGGVGGITALLAALIALTQTDLKRVLAYSTLSQLGYMFLALGAAGADPSLAPFAVFAAIFHLFTHACFKALLFLSAGSVMHAMGGCIDMRRFSGLRHSLPITHYSFLCGGLALAALPVFSGFWSKDEILAALHAGSHVGSHRGYYLLLFGTGVLTSFLTAFYTFRAYFLTFWGDEKLPPEAGHHPHDASAVMAIPMAILSLAALGVGGLFGPTHLFAHYLEKTPDYASHGHHVHSNLPMILGSVFALTGVLLAFGMYGRRSDLPERLAATFRPLYNLSLNRFYLDEIYWVLLVGPLTKLAYGLSFLDQRGLDGLVDAVGRVPAVFGRGLRWVQGGLVQTYALATFVGVAAILLVLLRSL
jgi:NADH-quinone oxidoreductase subunit L